MHMYICDCSKTACSSTYLGVVDMYALYYVIPRRLHPLLHTIPCVITDMYIQYMQYSQYMK